MHSTLERILLFLGSVAALLLLLTTIDHFFPFTGTSPPVERQLIGLGFDLCNFIFSLSSYVLLRWRKTLIGVGLIAVWSVLTLIYAFWLLLFDPLSVFTVGIFAGLLLFCWVMVSLSIDQVRSSGLLQNDKFGPHD